LDAYSQAAVRLKRHVVVMTGRLDEHHHTITLATGTDELHRGGEVLDIQPDAQRFWQVGFGEFQADLAALFLNVRSGGRVAQVNDHIAFTFGAALKVDAADGLARDRLALRLPLCRGSHGCTGCCRGNGRITQHQEEIIAFGTRAVRRHCRQVDDQPRAVLDLYHGDTARVTDSQVTGLHTQLVAYPGHVQGDARRLVDGVATRHGDRLVETELQLDAVAR